MTTLRLENHTPDPGWTLDQSDWTENAACRGNYSDDWYAHDRIPKERARQQAAKAICGSCPVRNKCLEVALENDEVEGIWGGLTADQRRSVKTRGPGRPKSPAICGTASGARRHQRDGTPTCADCRAAYNAYKAERKGRSA